jgi:glycine/D-amino acid oxidase-like deaminating enzyme/nitrite reductase/ring-hydroxylating ferredoxin subunit
VTENVWDQQDIKTKYPKLDKNVEADVVVVGAGIAGLSVAYNLLKEGKSVVVLEARAIGAGQSGRSTAHLMSWNDDYYMRLEDMHGEEYTKIIANSHRESINWVERVVSEENIDCNFQRVDGYLFPAEDSKEDFEKLEKERAAAHRAGLTDTEWVDLKGDPAAGGIGKALVFPGSADFHILKYLNGLAEAVVKHGGQIYENSRMFHQTEAEVETVDGFKVTAQALVFATNTPINHNLIVHTRQAADRTYVLAFKIPKDKFKVADYWDTAAPYHYVRREDKGDYDLLIVGGGDHATGMKPGEYPDSWGHLEQWTRERWTGAEEIVHRWTGQVLKPVDFLGMYGKDPANPSGKVYIATGDSGQGTTGGTIAGRVISDNIVGKDNPWAKVYDPSRLPNVGSLPKYTRESINSLQGLAEAALPKDDVANIADLPPNSGGVFQHGLDKIAAYKDTDGTVTTVSAICPHFKCSVQWNPKAETFDCPCHASHFDKYGTFIQGPARQGLAPIEINKEALQK